MTSGRGICPLPLAIWHEEYILCLMPRESSQVPPWRSRPQLAGACPTLCVPPACGKAWQSDSRQQAKWIQGKNLTMSHEMGRGICPLPLLAWLEEYALFLMPRKPPEQFKDCGSATRAPLQTATPAKPLGMLVPPAHEALPELPAAMAPCKVLHSGR